MFGRCIGFIAPLVLVFGIASGAANAASELANARPKIALVMGNSNYAHVPKLPNPEKDANAMADFLAKAGFDVTRANNLTLNQMHRTLRDFVDKVAAAGPDADVVVEYDGHGAQSEGENYLIPVDAQITREADLPIVAMRLNDVMNILSSVPMHNFVGILNACRNNPFSAINKIGGPGLAIADTRKNSILAYATAPGATALDGDGDHSPFTFAMLKVAATPGLPVEQVFKRVRLEVNTATKGEQTPWDSSSLTRDFYFIPPVNGTPDKKEALELGAVKRPTIQSEPSPQVVAEWREKLSKVSAEEAYDMVILANVVEAYEAYLTVFPKVKYVVRIQKIVDEQLLAVAWYEAFTINTEAAYEAFLLHYPDSAFAHDAKRLLERAKNRSLSPVAFANANANAAVSPKIITKTKIVEKVVEKPIVVTKIVEKPVIVEKIVRKIVRVPGPCECRDCGRRTRRKGPIIIDNGPVRRQHIQRQPRTQQFHGERSFRQRY